MNKNEIVKILTEHKKWYMRKGGSRANLRGADLSGAYLSGANLSGADLSGADLSGADLSRANLSGADLSGADLSGAYLSDAYLSRAYLSRANLSGANLSGADLSGADLSGADLSRANLSGADLSGADLSGAYLSDAYLSRAYLSRANLSGANLSRANLSCANLSKTIYEGVNWLYLFGIIPDAKNKARAYKVTNNEGEGIYNGGINYSNATKFSVPKVDKDKYTHCSFGINLANLAWCLSEYREDYRLFMMEFSTKPSNCICPIGSDGKFRVKSCVKIGECNWKGELLA